MKVRILLSIAFVGSLNAERSLNDVLVLRKIYQNNEDQINTCQDICPEYCYGLGILKNSEQFEKSKLSFVPSNHNKMKWTSIRFENRREKRNLCIGRRYLNCRKWCNV